MLASKPCSTPIEFNLDNKKVVFKFDDDVPLTGITNYQKLMGKLFYLTMTRPGLSYVVHCLSQVMHNPMQSHLRLAFRVLRYLEKEHGLGITFKESDNADLKVFVDFDWAKCKITRRFITGYAVFLRNKKVAAGFISTKKVKSEDNVAYIFTKGLSIADRNKFCKVLGLFNVFQSELRVFPHWKLKG
ncbi:hypothetical protein Tco_1211385 [Tanacetum coccineum]